MSFTTTVKDELCAANEQKECCRHAMAYGLLLFGGAFQPGDVSILTEHAGTARRYADAIVGLREGHIVFCGPPGALTPETLRTIYGDEFA